jgi:hypothetical protein
MKADFTRDTFKPDKHYSGVRMQQGRVQMDADWNEQVDIANHRIDTGARDIVGCCGTPMKKSGFHIVNAITGLSANDQLRPENQIAAALSAGDFYISAGRYYVNGILCENEKITRFSDQPTNPLVPTQVGQYIACLDVWPRHITWIEDSEIRDIALDGPDTATRVQTHWDVKLLKLKSSEAGANCLSDVVSYDDAIAPGDGKLAAQAKPDDTSTEPCIVAPGAGYRRLENQLYRIEAHKSGKDGTATFKWSRDNGSVVTQWTQKNGDELTVKSAGRDDVLNFSPGDWIELIDEGRELTGTPGTLVEILKIVGTKITIKPSTATGPVDLASFPVKPRVRRWDSKPTIKPVKNAWVDIEDGVQIKISKGQFKTGDYWLVPARTATPYIDWPKDATNLPLQVSPHGVPHHYCRLAVMDFDGATWTVIHDCRPQFPPATELTNLFYVSGDGQEAMPTFALKKPLQVGVSNGQWPVEGARVKFTRKSTVGKLLPGASAEESGSDIERIVLTDAAGIAEVKWQLGTNGTNYSQQVEAILMNVDDEPVHIPIRFNANLSLASAVLYEPRECPLMPAPQTVQSAIDTLAAVTTIHYHAGDGQEARPGQPLPHRVEVAVRNHCRPVENASVTVVAEGNGRVAGAVAGISSSTTNTLNLTTNAEGLAACAWMLDVDPTKASQQLTAKLVNAGGLPMVDTKTVVFTANHSLASEVQYDNSGCSLLKQAGADTVQQAIDQLCKRDPGRSGCSVTVGPEGEYADVKLAIEKLLSVGVTDMCLCVMPGDQDLSDGLALDVDPALHVRIKLTGCGDGSRLTLKQPWKAAGVEELAVRDLSITLPSAGAFMAFSGCGEVMFESCTISGVSNSLALISMGDVDRIRFVNNYVEATKRNTFILPANIFRLVVDDGSSPFKTFSVGAARTEAKMIASAVKSSSLANRRKMLTKFKAAVRSHSDNLGKFETAALNRFVDVAGVSSPSASRIAASILNIRTAFLRKTPGAAVSIVDGQADAVVADNLIYGSFSLYGAASTQQLDDGTLKSFHGRLRAQNSAISISGDTGRLHLRDNRLSDLVIPDTIINQMKAMISNPKGNIDVFRSVFITDNVFLQTDNVIMGQTVSLSGNCFDGESKTERAAAAISEAAFYTTNTGTAASPANVLAHVSKTVPPPPPPIPGFAGQPETPMPDLFEYLLNVENPGLLIHSA